MWDRAGRKFWGALGVCALMAACGDAAQITNAGMEAPEASASRPAQSGGDGATQPAPDAPASPHPAPDPVADEERLLAVGLSFVPSPDWIQAAARGMRAAQFTLPAGADRSQDAELALFFFGVGRGGSVADNIDRWCSQFVQADGSNSRDSAWIEKRNVGELELTVVSVSGQYSATSMPGMAPSNIPGEARMLAAIVEGAGGPWFFKALGSRPTIDRWEASIDAMLGSLRPTGGEETTSHPTVGV